MGSRPKAICILGMHRSGTSTITRAINLLGVYLGEETDLYPPAPDNPEGYWERIDINKLLDRILDRHMRGWDAILPLPEGWHLGDETSPFRSELTDLIKRVFSGHPLWAWKDPRTSILFDLWKHVLQDLNTELICLFAIRNPLDVAKSLEKRDGMPRDKAYGIWFNYNITALNAISGIPCVFVSYDRLLADWETELTRCAKGLGIPWPHDTERLHKEMNEFIRPELCHSSSTLEDLKAANAPQPVMELYGILLRALNDREGQGEAFAQNVKRLSDDFSSYARFFRDDMEKLHEKETVRSTFIRQLAEKNRKLELIQSSLGWRFISRCARIADGLLPKHTRRRSIFNAMIKKLNTLLGGSRRPQLPAEEKRARAADAMSRETVHARHRISLTDNDYFKFLFEMNNSRGKDYVAISHPELPETDIKLIAFYLPQFHPIPENDEWWGKNFTEWTNVTRAVPQFIGHYQPRLPGELGFYDLRIPDIQKRQVELAKQYGIHGFCFHFYWFNGKRLLEKPLEQFLSNPEMGFPFCISWANENWTRQWDGLDKEILIAQRHSPDDDLAFIQYVTKYLKDDRYIRINSKPLLVVYRPALLPDPRQTAERWRAWCRQNGIGEIYLALTHSFEHLDPREIGFDAAIEFAPNTFPLRNITDQFELANDEYQGQIQDYKNALVFAKNYENPPYTKFRGICPGWDNEARRPGRSKILANSSPEIYKQWLEMLCGFTRRHFDPQERIIFVNAWNEWTEGAYLEPDRKFGYAYLQKTAEALSSTLKVSIALPDQSGGS